MTTQKRFINLVNENGARPGTGAVVNASSRGAESHRRSTKGEKARDRLLEAAKVLFLEQGYASTRVKDIAARVGQSNAAFYYYFDSKEELFRELVVMVDDCMFATLDDLFLGGTAAPSYPRVHDAMRRHLERYYENARILSLIDGVARSDAAISAMRIARHKQLTVRSAEMIRRLQQQNLADPALDPEISAVALGGLTQRFAELWFMQPEVDFDFIRDAEHLARVFVGAINLQVQERRSEADSAVPEGSR